MKYMVLLGDGMADWPLPAYEGRTPLQVAHTPALDRLARQGITGLFCPIPEGLPPGSDVGNLSLFGYDPRTTFGGRAPIEAANQGIPMNEDQVAFRCNLVTLADGVMQDFTAGHITSAEGARLMASLNDRLPKRFPAVFHPGVSYRHLTVLTATPSCTVDHCIALTCEPPHNITGQAYTPFLPKGEAAALVMDLMACAQEILRDHPVNAARIQDGLAPANSIWLWGQGKSPAMATYQDKFGITGAVISAVDLVKGIGKLAGLEVIDVPGATGWIDTNYEGKITAGLKALETHDFIYIHIEAPDEAAHQGRADLKIRAIEDFDRFIVGPALAYQEKHPDCRILAAPDHFTTIETKTHAGGPLPFALSGPGIVPNGGLAYSEADAAQTGLVLPDAHTLVARMFQDPTIRFG